MTVIRNIKPIIFKKIVYEILHELYNREGFKDWMDELDPEIEKEIENNLFEIIKRRVENIK